MMRFLVRFTLVLAFIYISYVFGFRGKEPNPLDYFILVFCVLIALRLDRKDFEKKTGLKTSIKEEVDSFINIYKEMYYVIILKRWREERQIKKKKDLNDKTR